MEHYFKQTNTALEDHDYILIDGKSTFQNFNKFASTDIEVFLIDSDNKVLSAGSPFSNSEIYNL